MANRKSGEIIVRIRQEIGHEGHSNFAFHADVIGLTPTQALKAAEEGQIWNWRWIDTFDQAPETYRRFVSLGRIASTEAHNPAHVWDYYSR